MGRQVGLKQAVKEGRLDLHYFAEHTLDMIRQRMGKQKVWPFGHPGPYREYKYINSKKKDGQWKSTGAAEKQMYAIVYNAAGGDTTKISFFFEHYMNFVDMGVGKGRRIGDVTERGTPAHYNTLFAKWGGMSYGKGRNRDINTNGGSARRSRPMMMMELRHQAVRLRTLASSYFDALIPVLMGSTDYEYKDNFNWEKDSDNAGWYPVIHPKTEIKVIK